MPFAPGTFHEQLYGTVESVQTCEPLTKKSTLSTPTLSLAVALSARVVRRATVAPVAGAVIVAVGGVVSDGGGGGGGGVVPLTEKEIGSPTFRLPA